MESRELRATESNGCTRPLSRTGRRPKLARSKPLVCFGACAPPANQNAKIATKIQGIHFFIHCSFLRRPARVPKAVLRFCERAPRRDSVVSPFFARSQTG